MNNPQQPEQQVPDPAGAATSASLESGPAVMRATLHITRKATGLTETIELVGRVEPPPEPHVKDAPQE